MCMAATFPGRTHGLGMITEALLADLNLSELTYGYFNLWTTLFGALFCIPAGAALDRYGCRNTLAVILFALGISVIAMSAVQDKTELFISLLATRGLGQSALSVASISLISKYFSRQKLGFAMGVYSVLTSIFFMAVFGGVGQALERVPSMVAFYIPNLVIVAGWRVVWCCVGGFLLVVCLPLVLLCIRRQYEITVNEHIDHSPEISSPPEGASFGEAIRTGAFWIFGLSISFFNLVSSGVGLYNESILVERGYDVQTYHFLLVLAVPFGLFANMLVGYLAPKAGVKRLLIICMAVMGASKFMFPLIETQLQVYIYTAVFALSGGGLSVLFFIIWADLFGKREVGRIQGAAQMLTVVASAAGPVLFAWSKELTFSYTAAFYLSGALTFAFAIAACFVKIKTKNHA